MTQPPAPPAVYRLPTRRLPVPIHTILALTDFSNQAERALDRAALLAAAHQARLRIVYASDTPPLQLADPYARLEQRARQLARRHSVQVTAVSGSGQRMADAMAEADRADLLVVHHTMHRGPFWRRSALSRLLQRSPCPVLVVRQSAQADYEQVLVAVDFSATSRPQVRYASGFAPGAALEIFHAIDTGTEAWMRRVQADTSTVQAYRREVQAQAQDQMFQLSDSFDTRRNRVGTLIGRGCLARHLEVQQECVAADLIVVGQPRRTAWFDVLRGSVARKLLGLGLGCDLLLLPHDSPNVARSVVRQRGLAPRLQT